jgi:hypothetical protein
MSTAAARTPQPTPSEPIARADAGLGAEESQVTPVAPAEGRPSPGDIAREAYLIYLANGARDGRHDEDWYEAERRLCAASDTRQSAANPQQTAAQLDDVDAETRTPG